MSKLRAVLVALALAIVAAALAGPSTAAAASCTGTPHDVANPSDDGFNNQVDVSCDTAISNGKITVRVNRGGDIKPHPAIKGGSGALDCKGEEQAPGSAFDLAISCTGSMSAGATAAIVASFGPNACDSPKFSGDLAATFGDGTSFGPSALAGYDCSENPGSGGGGGQQPSPGHDFDPGGVFQGVSKAPPAKASVGAARKGLKFVMKLGVKGKVVVTIEVKGKLVGKTSKRTGGGATHLVARLGKASAKALKGHPKRAKIHVHVVPDASEGFTTPGEKYFKLKLTG